MSLTPQQLAELDSLLSDLADERLSEERRLVLEALLEAEPEARDYYIRFLALCSDLHESAATCLSAGNDDGPPVAASLRDANVLGAGLPTSPEPPTAGLPDAGDLSVAAGAGSRDPRTAPSGDPITAP